MKENLEVENSILRHKLLIAEEALEFYGSLESWNSDIQSSMSPVDNDWEHIGEGRYWGKKAREALARIQGERK